MKEEIFGPVCHIAPFDSEEEAVKMANDTKYGLAASIWTTNLKRGTSCRTADECWHYLGELLVPARLANSVWRNGIIRNWSRRRHAFAEFLFGTQ